MAISSSETVEFFFNFIKLLSNFILEKPMRQGGVEEGETFGMAAIREASEELGIPVGEMKLLEV